MEGRRRPEAELGSQPQYAAADQTHDRIDLNDLRDRVLGGEQVRATLPPLRQDAPADDVTRTVPEGPSLSKLRAAAAERVRDGGRGASRADDPSDG